MSLVLYSDQQKAYKKISGFLSAPIKYSLDSKENKFFILSGWAGTGKTSLVGHVHDTLTPFGSVFTAPTNKATKVLQSTLGNRANCKTIYSLLGIKMVADEDRLVLEFPRIPVDLSSYINIFVDEASMTNKTLLDYIKERSKRASTRWVFIGDRGQIPPVGEKHSRVWRLECDSAHLEEVIRHDNEILNLATHIRRAIQRFKKNPDPELTIESDHGIDTGVWKYRRDGFLRQIERAAKQGLFSQPDHTKLVAWRNRTVADYNQFIRLAIFGKEAGHQPYLIGDRLMIGEPVMLHGQMLAHIDDEGTVVARSESYHSEFKDLNAYNVTLEIDGGTTVNLNILHPASESQYRSRLNTLAAEAKKDTRKWKDFWFLRNAFHAVRHSYAITSHRAQGSSYENCMVDVSDILANSNSFECLRILYVAFTRARLKLILS